MNFDALLSQLAVIALPAFGINALTWVLNPLVKMAVPDKASAWILRVVVLLLGAALGWLGYLLGEFGAYEAILRGAGFAGLALVFYHAKAFLLIVKYIKKKASSNTEEDL